MSCLHALPSFLVHFIFFFKMKHATAEDVTAYMGVGTLESICRSATGVGTVGLCTKRSCKAACCVSSSTSFVCLHHPFQFCLLETPPKKSKKSPELKKLGSLSTFAKRRGCQMACLFSNVVFHAYCDKHAISAGRRNKTLGNSLISGPQKILYLFLAYSGYWFLCFSCYFLCYCNAMVQSDAAPCGLQRST